MQLKVIWVFYYGFCGDWKWPPLPWMHLILCVLSSVYPKLPQAFKKGNVVISVRIWDLISFQSVEEICQLLNVASREIGRFFSFSGDLYKSWNRDKSWKMIVYFLRFSTMYPVVSPHFDLFKHKVHEVNHCYLFSATRNCDWCNDPNRRTPISRKRFDRRTKMCAKWVGWFLWMLLRNLSRKCQV